VRQAGRKRFWKTPDTGRTGHRDEGIGARRGYLDGLFQKDVLARLGATAGDIEMCIRRRQKQDGLDRAIIKDGLEPVGERKIEVLAETFPTRRRRTVGVDDFDPIRQIPECPGVWGNSHAETDQCDALLGCSGQLVLPLHSFRPVLATP
jgi:hypothetical protein